MAVVYSQNGVIVKPTDTVGGWPYRGIYSWGSSTTTRKISIDCNDNSFYCDSHSSSADSTLSTVAPRFTFGLTRAAELDVSIDFKLDFSGLDSNQTYFNLLGTPSAYNTAGTMAVEFNTANGLIILLMANNNSWGDTGNVVAMVDTNTVNKTYMSSKICNVKIRHFANTDDFQIEYEGTKSAVKTFTAPNYGGSPEMSLGGTTSNINSFLNNLGRIYMSSYVKINGDYLPLPSST